MMGASNASTEIHGPGDARIDEQKILCIETSARRCDRGGDRHRAELDDHRIDAQRLGGVLVFSHRHEIGAEPDPFDHAHEDQRRANQPEQNPIERCTALKLERLRSQIELDERADARPGDGCNARNDAKHLGERERH
jgi:hypothetical protein